MKGIKTKIILFFLCWFTILLMVINPTFGLNIFTVNSQSSQSEPINLINGFVGSSYVSYSVNTQVSNNTITGYILTVSIFSFSSLFILVVPIILFIYYISSEFNLSINKKNMEI